VMVDTKDEGSTHRHDEDRATRANPAPPSKSETSDGREVSSAHHERPLPRCETSKLERPVSFK
jgi:hypothetical protein